MLENRSFGQDAILIPHPFGRNDLLNGRHVDDVVRSVQERRHVMRLVSVHLTVLLLLLDHGLSILPLSLVAARLMRNVMVSGLAVHLASLAPDAADLKVVAVGWKSVAADEIVVVFTIAAQHADGQEDQEDEDASASDRDGDGGRFEPQIVTAASDWNVLAVEQSGLDGYSPEFNAWNR